VLGIGGTLEKVLENVIFNLNLKGLRKVQQFKKKKAEWDVSISNPCPRCIHIL
jgi:hypothetical protein